MQLDSSKKGGREVGRGEWGSKREMDAEGGRAMCIEQERNEVAEC